MEGGWRDYGACWGGEGVRLEEHMVGPVSYCTRIHDTTVLDARKSMHAQEHEGVEEVGVARRSEGRRPSWPRPYQSQSILFNSTLWIGVNDQGN